MDQLDKADGLRSIRRWTSRAFVKESTAIDVTRLAIEQIEKIFLQGLAASPRFDREGATRGFRDAPNLESNHECILPSAVAAGRWSQLAIEQPSLSPRDVSLARTTPSSTTTAYAFTYPMAI
jgi:hypothetical protein